jgi:hypothetical protein
MRAIALAACTLALLAPAAATAGEVAGRVGLTVEGARLADLGPTVVFLESLDAPGIVPASAGRPVLRQRNARFDPEFLVVVAGQSVKVANDDTIFHNVFSFSRPNDFDLGVYPVSATGDYRIPGVPPGRYKLTAWNERLPAVTRTFSVGDDTVRADLQMGSSSP